PLEGKREYEPGERLNFNLVLVGKTIDYLPYFIYAFDQMGKTGIGRKSDGGRAAFALKEVAAGREIVYSSLNGKMRQGSFTSDLTLPDPSCEQGKAVSEATLTLRTPLRLKYDNHLNAVLPFHVLVRAMLRRASSLLQYHGGGEPALDYRGLAARAEAIRVAESSLRWFDWKRFSNRQDQSMLLGGMVGSVAYIGDITEYISLIRFCEKVHLGKQTSFGLGKIELTRIA
ncbi:MAG: CRISPR system precrRNA processing endoribonuclease RAMP protein Cas6, partial [Smithellaceae bacterium]|nr:CRISPR system precrRNA processing endoribonuclease RAMP protein Cas6 [Smithellaceae bacterium]